MERGLGLRLVDRHTGGAGGGGTHLTAAGRDLVDRFNVLAAAVERLPGGAVPAELW